MSATPFNPTCPIPLTQYPVVVMAHGGGGKLMQQLIEKMFKTAFQNEWLGQGHDSAVFQPPKGRLAMTTDSFVVKPLFFPGGDIGSLSIFGTVNDLAMSGARPLYLSAGFILEEGLPMEQLWKIVLSMKQAAETAGIKIITGDTKVVDKGKGDGMFINTAGLGVVEHDRVIAPRSVQAGDAVIVSGDLGRHGIAVMAAREGLSFKTTIQSDAAPLWEPVSALLKAGLDVHCLRDLTRGGLTSAVNEIAEAVGCEIFLEESKIPVQEQVHAACELLGLDPLYTANEGRFIAFVPEKDAARAVQVLKCSNVSQGACIIGQVTETRGGMVKLKSMVGTTRILDMHSGEQLPRIC